MKKKLTLNEIKNLELELLLELQRVCKDHNLTLYLCGGTLLGAVRHKGFIPWDDDIDVCLPRPDYDKLISLAKKERLFSDHISLISYEDGTLEYPFAKLLDLRTECDMEYLEGDSAKHLWIDVLPVDALPEDTVEIEKIYKKTSFLRRMLAICTAKKGTGKTLSKRLFKGLFMPFIKLPGTKGYSNRIIKLAKASPYETANKVGIITWGLYGAREAMPKDRFVQSADVDFEKHQFETMSCWNSYLRNLYGDYMKLPPEDKRKTHDMAVYTEDQE